jgi:hypothetical protein
VARGLARWCTAMIVVALVLVSLVVLVACDTEAEEPPES